jgi:hypothetical protein
LSRPGAKASSATLYRRRRMRRPRRSAWR